MNFGMYGCGIVVGKLQGFSWGWLILSLLWVSFVIHIGMDMHLVLCLAFKLVSVNLG